LSKLYYDFFAGGGMAGVGLGDGWTCAFANDIDEMKAAAYRAHHGSEHLLVRDVRKVSVSDLPSTAELAWASFPCQDLSLAGGGAGLSGERSGMFWPFWHLMRALDKEGRAPKVIALENVFGILTSNGGQDFATIASAFSGRGYRFGAVVIDAVHFVPQSRPRVFFIGVRKDVRLPQSVVAQHPSDQWHPKALRAAHTRLSKSAASKWIWWHLPSPKKRNSTLSSIIEDQPTGVAWHTPDETKYILGLMSRAHRERVESMKLMRSRVVGTIYRRTRPDGDGGKVQRAEVRFDEVAGCLRTPRGGSSRQTILIIENGKIRSRLLSPREAARLMGLPDEYPLPSRYNDAYHVAGDGVAPPVVRHLAYGIIEPILAQQSAVPSMRRGARKHGRA
jgi:DNA (cytosine-5)-methyltransferase 1